MYDYENVEIVSIKKGDTLVFFVDTDYYDLEDIDQLMESVKSAFPSAKVLMLPDDMIDDKSILSFLLFNKLIFISPKCFSFSIFLL